MKRKRVGAAVGNGFERGGGGGGMGRRARRVCGAATTWRKEKERESERWMKERRR